MHKPIRLLLADDHALVRDVLAQRLAGEADLLVVGAVGTADEAVTYAFDARPDVILLDIDMPGLLCFDAARTIGQRCPETAIIFLSAHFHDRYIEQALAVQAAGYITKTEPVESVVRAIRSVAAGGCYFSAEVQARLVVDTGGPGWRAGRHRGQARLRRGNSRCSGTSRGACRRRRLRGRCT